jgi:hypothetical protein
MLTEVDTTITTSPTMFYDYYHGHNIAGQDNAFAIEKICCQIGIKSLKKKKKIFH